jgi:hypothetical protein
MEDTEEGKQFRKLDKDRYVHNADVLFDSNVIEANDPLAERRLLALSELLVEKPDRGHIWFSLTSLSELLGPSDAAMRIELLKRFQNLYRRLGDRVRFYNPKPFASVFDEWNDANPVYARVDSIDEEVTDAIKAGDLVGQLKIGREHWEADRARLWQNHANNVNKYRATYKSDPAFREAFKKSVELLRTSNALEQCDDIATQLIVTYAKRQEADLELAKAKSADYPCTWTYSLLVRLADYAATLTKAEWKANFAQYGRLLKSDRNDYLDAYIAATGGACGMLITNDEGLIDKLNFLHDAQPQLVRLQGITVFDALKSYNPPNGDRRDWSKPIP